MEKTENNEIKFEELIHSAFNSAKRDGSLKEAFLEHAQTYGIEGIDQLFPEAKLASSPEFINNNIEWVEKVLSGTTKLPFAKVRSLFADITAESIRAKGYTKGGLKKETVFELLKRTTSPTTIYKKEKLDRDDVVDITDLDVVAWVKSVMKIKLNEEIARAILIGDGRSNVESDKINEECIRPIVSDSELFSVKVELGDIKAVEDWVIKLIDGIIVNRKQYKGSGNPVLYTTEDIVSAMLIVRDGLGARMYKSVEELKTALRVSDIVTVGPLEGFMLDSAEVLAIMVNMSDYSVGTNKGGQVSLFDDFDIDYNQQKYLIETRCSGALTKPKSALVFTATGA